MGLRDLVLTEDKSKRSFIISDKDCYDSPIEHTRFTVHGPIKDKYVVIKHENPCSVVLDILDYEEEAIGLAYLKAKDYAAEWCKDLLNYEDKTSFNK